MTTTHTGTNKNVIIIGVRDFQRNFAMIYEKARLTNKAYLVMKGQKEIGTFTPTLLPKKKYTIDDLMNFRFTMKKPYKNLSRDIDKFVYGN